MSTPRRERRFGPLPVLLPALILAIVAALLFRRPPMSLRLAPPAVSDPEEAVPALAGHLRAADGSALAVRLTTLHADPDRQSFEAASLRRRLDLPEGEPWRLTLRWDPAPSRGGPAGRDGPAAGPEQPAGLALGPLEVRDESGQALTLIAPAAMGGPVGDPLRTLLGPPTGALRPGQTVDWILWGRRPEAGARVVGLLPPEGAPEARDFERSTGLRGPLLLEAGSARRVDLVVPVARLDRSAPGAEGKIRAAEASEEDRDTRLPEDD